MAQTYAKNKLSASTNGLGIKVGNTATIGNLLHTAVAGTGDFDELWIYAHNESTTAVLLTLEWGGASVPDNVMSFTCPAKAGRFQLVDGQLINNAKNVTCFANSANYIIIDGFVNEIRTV